jgi:hypothetical protein
MDGKSAASAGTVQILRIGSMEQPGPAAPAGLHYRKAPRFGPALAIMQCEDQKDALDTLYNLAGIVGAGNGHFLYRWRANSRPVGDCVDRNGIPPDPGTQGYLGAGDWAADCCLKVQEIRE